jgi:hypothetical protein
MEQSSIQLPEQQNFQFLFDKLEELKATHKELFAADSNGKNTLPPSVEEIKRIIEACNTQEPFTTFTKV